MTELEKAAKEYEMHVNGFWGISNMVVHSVEKEAFLSGAKWAEEKKQRKKIHKSRHAIFRKMV